MNVSTNPNTSIHSASQQKYLTYILLKKIQIESLLLLKPRKFKIHVFYMHFKLLDKALVAVLLIDRRKSVLC